MQKALKLALAVILALGLLGPVGLGAMRGAAEVTMTGKIVCALCTLNKADQKDCQDVFVSNDEVEYYIEKNKTATDAGHVCTSEVSATVTGTVSEKDGKKWITASKITKR